MTSVRDRLTDAGYALGWTLVCRVPESWARGAFQFGADIAWRRQGHSVQVLEGNLRRVAGPSVTGKQLRALSRQTLRSYARYWLESFRLPVLSQDRIQADMHVTGEEKLQGNLAAGRGVIIALPHTGNYELAGVWIIHRGVGKFTTVAERLKPESLFRRFLDFREGLGMEVLPASGGDSRFGVLAQRLRAGGLVCLVSDRDVTGRGIEVEFFGEKARMMAGPAALAVQTGAALLPTTLWFDGDGWGARIYDEVPVPEAGTRREKVAVMTQAVARAYEDGIRAHPQDWHMLQKVFVADLDPERLAAADRAARGESETASTGTSAGTRHQRRHGRRAVRVGIVCPYTWAVPGGVQQHIRDLAEALIGLGHQVSVISPADDDTPLPAYVVPAGRAVPVPYNGSVARLAFGFLSASRVRRWVKEGGFDVLHVHEPAAPSLSLLACWVADGPIVATVHTATPRSRVMHAAYPALQTALEKITGRIAVSEAARTTLVEHMGGDAVLIPNGVTVSRYEKAAPLPGWPGEGGALGFLGRMDEPRKGLDVLLRAFAGLGAQRPGLRLLIAGPGDTDDVLARVPGPLRPRVILLGQVSEEDKARVYHSVDVFCAPNTGGESFGIVLAEAMAAGAPIVASDLDAFRQVLRGGRAGELFETGDPAALAEAAGRLLDDPQRRIALSAAAAEAVRVYDWPVVARDVVRVYEAVVAAYGQVGVAR